MQEVGFEPTTPKRPVPETSALDHSATLASFKTTVAGFEPTPLEEKWFRVTRLRPLGHTVLIYIILMQKLLQDYTDCLYYSLDIDFTAIVSL